MVSWNANFTWWKEIVMNELKRIYESERTYPNNLSVWFPKVMDCGIKVPETMIFDVPVEVYGAINGYGGATVDSIRKFLEAAVITKMTRPEYFLKNGCYSNKFNFANCITNRHKLLGDVLAISEASLCNETGGTTELVLREVIPHDTLMWPSIYNGMPLRPEIRVFYDFDRREVMYSVNYWDYDTVRPHLRKRTDCIVFDAMRSELRWHYENDKERVETLVAEHMKNVDMSGQWSIDILLDDYGKPWLIDMAQAARSAYWKWDFAGREKPAPKPFTPELAQGRWYTLFRHYEGVGMGSLPPVEVMGVSQDMEYLKEEVRDDYNILIGNYRELKQQECHHNEGYFFIATGPIEKIHYGIQPVRALPEAYEAAKMIKKSNAD